MEIKKFKDQLALLRRIKGYIVPDSTEATTLANMPYPARMRAEADRYEQKEADLAAFDSLLVELEAHEDTKEVEPAQPSA